MAQGNKKSVAYLRTSSRTNVGQDKDSDKRQLAAIEAYAKVAGFEIVGAFFDAAVSGADAVNDRRGFTEMLEQLLSNGARTILVESPDPVARSRLMTREGEQSGIGGDDTAAKLQRQAAVKIEPKSTRI
jgi:DNA invertase Pin-like site-specific DNA recombinase